MSSLQSDSKCVADDENEEEKIYRLIYGMNTIYDKEEKEKVQTPPSSQPTLVHLKMNADVDDSEDKMINNTTQAEIQKDQEDDNTKEPDMDAIDDIQGKSVQKANVKERPWRKPGADISDYFNYGFDEDSWTTYCRKQSKLRAANRKLYSKIMVKMGHTIHEEKVSSSACPSSGTQSIPASRQSRSATDMTEEQPGPSGRMEGCPSLSAEGGNSTQAVTEMSPEEGRLTSYHLSPQSKVISPLEVTVPSSATRVIINPEELKDRGEQTAFLDRPLSPHATLDSGQSKGFDDTFTSPCPCSSGAPSLIPRTASSRAGVINTAKGWECDIWKERRERKYRDRSRDRDHDKDGKRGRDTDKETCSLLSSSGEEHMRDKDTTERRHKHHSLERFRGEKEEQHTERRRSDKREAAQKSSCSSSKSRRDSGEDRDSQSKRKRKKAKRSRKRKKTNKMSSADQGGELK